MTEGEGTQETECDDVGEMEGEGTDLGNRI